MTASVDDAVIEDCEPQRRRDNEREADSAAVLAAGYISSAFLRLGSIQSGRGK